MDDRVLTVDDLFDIPAFGGLLVVPGPLQKDWSSGLNHRVRLRRPDGSVIEADLTMQHVFQTPPPEELRWTCILRGVGRDDVPIGTEVWIAP
jgi:hypothetical protein